jgi:hypothetical protein
MSTRVYIPSSTRRLRDVLVSGGLGPAPMPAHAVTERLREALGEENEEDREYGALTAAAQDSVGLIGDGEQPLRVVVVAEADSVTPVTPVRQGEESLVEVDAVVPLAKVVAVHVDSDDAADAVARAREVWAAAQEGDTHAQDMLARCLDHELGWYATQEIGNLVERS